MSRRKKRTAARRANRTPAEPARPPADEPAGPIPNPPRPRKWFLATAVLLQAAWTAFLVAMVLWVSRS